MISTNEVKILLYADYNPRIFKVENTKQITKISYDVFLKKAGGLNRVAYPYTWRA